MKAETKDHLPRSQSNGAISLLILCCLIVPCDAVATAPRIAPPLFGDDSQADVVGYQSAPIGSRAKAEEQLILALLRAAFEVSGIQPIIDILPSKQLAHYEFVVNEVPGLIVNQHDIKTHRLAHAQQVVFYLKGTTDEAEAIVLLFSDKNPRARELHRVFDKGLQAIVANGRYLDVMQQYLGAGELPSGMIGRLKRLNPGWK